MSRRLIPLVALLSLSVPVADAQVRDTSHARGALLSGAVHDSLAGVPLGGAAVQIVSRDTQVSWSRSAITDAQGRYEIAGVPDGRYTVGFFHPMLDSLGLEPLVRAVEVQGGREVRADLAIPSAARIAFEVCGRRQAAAGALVMGLVRDARTGEPVAGAEVRADWIEYTFTTTGVLTSLPHLSDTTRANGWFGLCNVPAPGRIVVTTTREGDSSDRIEVELTSVGFARRDLYVGARDSSTQRLTGVVLAVAGSRPVRDALVGIAGGPQVRTNDRGEWVLDAPSGTRVLEVHAIGFYPERVTVNVIPGTPPIRTSLFTMRAMLDTIKVVAKRMTPAMKGFEDRRRTGMGKYLDAAYIERRHVAWTSELFHMVPGVYVTSAVPGSGEEGGVKLREPTDMGFCAPAFFLDGAYVDTLTSGTLDAFVSPEDIAGIEIYRAPLIPAQFMTGGRSVMTCGAIAVWTAPAFTRSHWSLKRRVFTGVALMGTGYLLNGLVRHLFGR